MTLPINPDAILTSSDDVVAREIEGELILVPLVAGIGDTDEELFTLNETGKAIWGLLDGNRTLKDVAAELASEYDSATDDIENDVAGLARELLNRKMLVVVS